MKKALSILLSVVIMVTVFNFSLNTSYGADQYSANNYARACCHDPSIVKGKDGRYYTFGSHISYSYSDDLINWYGGTSTMDGDGTKSLLSYNGMSWMENCSKAIEWLTLCQLADGRFEEHLEYGCWAPTVIYNDTMSKWCMYVSFSYWGTVNSVIGLAVSDTIEGPYEFVDTMVYSGFTSEVKTFEQTPIQKKNYTHTNVDEVLDKDFLNSTIKNSGSGWFRADKSYNCDYGKFPNCIDPTAFTDKSGDMWMVYGSYSGGTFVVPLVEETGLIDYAYMKAHQSDGYDRYFGMRISNTCPDNECTGEGPYIVYDSESDYYYFYLTYGGLAGDGGYNIREYRSKNPDGPYVDKAGNKATDMKNTGAKLMGNYRFTCQPTAYLSGGHSSSFVDDDGKMYQAYHTRFTCDGGWGHQLRVHQMLRTKDGWAVMLPYEYQGETVSANGYSVSEITGEYEFVNHTNMTQRLEQGYELSSIVLPTQKIELAADGTIYCLKEYGFTLTNANTSSKSVSGTWSKTDGTYYATFKINGITYNGVFCKQKDESAAGNEVMTFSALGTNNAEIWGVQTNNHTPKISTTVTSRATTSSNGKEVKKCSVCGKVLSTTSISKIKSVTLSQTSYTYDGKAKKPNVVVKDGNGKTIPKSSYTVTYSNNKNVGKATVKITFKGNYSGTKTLYFTIKPRGTSITGLSAGSKRITVKLKKYTTQTTGYQIQYATDSKFTKNAKSVTISNKTTSKTINKLAGKKKYFVRVRTYKTVGGVKYYSAWSGTKAVTTKK